MIEKYIEAIGGSEKEGKLNQLDILTGYSGDKIIGTLQRLSLLLSPNECYVEVGVFQGMTLLNVAKGLENKKGVTAFGIDNFAQFDKQKKNQKLIEQRMDALKISNAVLINQDYEDALIQLKKYIGDKKVGVYFIDGPHDYRSQLMCLELIKPHLSDDAIILIDDSNYMHVRQANADFLISHPEFKLLFQAYTPVHPLNITEEARGLFTKGWWDGINIIVKDRKNILPTMFPPTDRDRTIFTMEHAVHSSRHAHLAPMAMDLISTIRPFNPFKFIFSFSYAIYKALVNKNKYEFRHMNTNSKLLTTAEFNKPIQSKINAN